MKRILLKMLVLLLSAFLIAACSTNDDDSGEDNNGNGTENGGNGNEGDEEDDGEDNGNENELEGYFLWDWDSFEAVTGSLYDIRENNYRLPFKNVDANPYDYEYGEYADSLIYPAVIFEHLGGGVRVPYDTTAYMVMYLVVGDGGFSLSAEHFYGDGREFHIHSRFYTNYKLKEVNFLYKRESMKHYWIRIISLLKTYTGNYFGVNSAMSLCNLNRYSTISHSSQDNLYFIERVRKIE